MKTKDTYIDKDNIDFLLDLTEGKKVGLIPDMLDELQKFERLFDITKKEKIDPDGVQVAISQLLNYEDISTLVSITSKPYYVESLRLMVPIRALIIDIGKHISDNWNAPYRSRPSIITEEDRSDFPSYLFMISLSSSGDKYKIIYRCEKCIEDNLSDEFIIITTKFLERLYRT